ncbi:MAG: glycosyltransferase family 2 protein [Owenweeksia sp.]|nr:glycosyltransferase family 2 protein [Owenweeksia sp.]
MQNFANTFFQNPHWIRKDQLAIEKFADFSEDYLQKVRYNLQQAVSDKPVATVILTTYNEEANIVRCLDSIAGNKTIFPFEVVVVNNNSSDRTAEALDYLGQKYYDQPIQGSGPARQMGMEKARGQYILLGDADCLYPETWIEKMVKTLTKNNTAVVYGRYSFMGSK